MPLRIGACAPMEDILTLAALGYDFLEGNLSQIAVMDRRAFSTLAATVDEAGIRVEVMGCMLPRELNVTGRGVNARLQHEYLDFAFARAKRLGCEVVVFASAGARQVPEDWPFDRAWRQIMNFLRLAERHALEHDLLICVEPLSRGECNLLNTVSEATLLCSALQLPHVRVLGDTYHMAMEHEPLASLEQAGGLLAHVHTANALGRRFPREGDGEDYRRLFATLEHMGYRGRVSIEGAYEDLQADGAAAFSLLDRERRFLGAQTP